MRIINESSAVKSDNTVEKSITIKAQPLQVWEVLTNPDWITKWLSDTGMEVVSDFKVGSNIVFRSKIHGIMQEDHGVVQEFEPGKDFIYSYWTKISDLADIPENHTIIEFRLIENEMQTILDLRHRNLIAKAAYEHSNFYWGVALSVIRNLVEQM